MAVCTDMFSKQPGVECPSMWQSALNHVTELMRDQDLVVHYQTDFAHDVVEKFEATDDGDVAVIPVCLEADYYPYNGMVIGINGRYEMFVVRDVYDDPHEVTGIPRALGVVLKSFVQDAPNVRIYSDATIMAHRALMSIRDIGDLSSALAWCTLRDEHAVSKASDFIEKAVGLGATHIVMTSPFCNIARSPYTEIYFQGEFDEVIDRVKHRDPDFELQMTLYAVREEC